MKLDPAIDVRFLKHLGALCLRYCWAHGRTWQPVSPWKPGDVETKWPDEFEGCDVY
jgi:hypothetical protein